MKSQTVKLHGLKHNLYSWGSPDKPLLLFLHGFLDCAASFQFVCDSLLSDFHCVAWDMRGYGKTEHTVNGHGYFYYEYMADLHALLKHLSPDKPIHLVGHSMGGIIGSVYAGTYPDRLKNFINVDGLLVSGAKTEDGPQRLKNWIEDHAKTQGFQVYESLEKLIDRLQTAYPRIPRERLEKIAVHESHKQEQGYQINHDPKHRWSNPYPFSLEHIYAFWQAITAPTFVILASESVHNRWWKADAKTFKTELKKRLDHYPSHTKIHEIQDCGHMVHMERPEELALLIKEFLL